MKITCDKVLNSIPVAVLRPMHLVGIVPLDAVGIGRLQQLSNVVVF